MSEEVARKICEQMIDSIDDLCECQRKNEKDRTCTGCRELAIKTILLENKQLKETIDKVREYITSYEAICTIQFGSESDDTVLQDGNKGLDEKTLNEMVNRYLKVHDKLLSILGDKESE